MRGALWTLWFVMEPVFGAASGQTIDIMFYNVFNLFDATHDEGKEDWTFLPSGYPGKDAYCESLTNQNYKEECQKSNWTEEHFQLKLGQIAKAIQAASPSLPDLLGLCEVENDNAVRRLAARAGFDKFVMTTSPDERGIDVALLFNEKTGLKFDKYLQHEIQSNLPDAKPTRNILEAAFTLANNAKLIVLVNHWPSQAAPSTVRVEVAKKLQALVNARISENPAVNIVMMGDFNTVEGDYPHPFKSVLLAPGAKNKIFDLHEQFYRNGSSSQELKNKMPLGTYFYPPKMSWDRLDRFFVNQNLINRGAWDVNVASYRIVNADLISKTYVYQNSDYFGYGSSVNQTPYRGNIYTLEMNQAGYSDHFPVVVQLVKMQ